MSMEPHERGLVGIIDEGTSTVVFCIFKMPELKEVTSHRIEIKMKSPKDGWFEQDPLEIMAAIYKSCALACERLPTYGYTIDDIAAIGITNQRETTIAWDKITGKPLYSALVWNDIRTNALVDRILSKFPHTDKNYLKHVSGLPVSPYFSAMKMVWLKENVPAVAQALSEGRCLFGTMDSWIIWNLTKGKLHITDVTNASRTLLMNIETLQWEQMLLRVFHLSVETLPEIRSCSEIYGHVSNEQCVLGGVAISGIIGNQQASLLGQRCIHPGQTKNTYRSGCFLLCNTGVERIISSCGLITTLAYKLGPQRAAAYALEGSVAVAGHALNWLENKVRLMVDSQQAERHASLVPTTGDVYFVPAFTGLYAPYWRKEARGIICGLTQFTTKNHIIRATLEAICYQSRDILECMHAEGGVTVTKLHVDGLLASNDLLMQLQADIGGLPVIRAQVPDTAAVGAAICTAHAAGIDLFDLQRDNEFKSVPYDTFVPRSTEEERAHRYAKWKRAVERSFDWSIKSKTTTMTDERYKLLASIPAAIYIISVFAMLVHAAAHVAGK